MAEIIDALKVEDQKMPVVQRAFTYGFSFPHSDNMQLFMSAFDAALEATVIYARTTCIKAFTDAALESDKEYERQRELRDRD